MTTIAPCPPLSPTDTHVWYARPDQLTSSRERNACQSLLSAAERKRYEAFHFEQDRHMYLVAHALLRTTLSKYANRAPAAWQFVTNAHGRPSLAAGSTAPIHFNLSHTAGLVACAITRLGTVGIDVEATTRTEGLLDTASHVFSPREVADLAATHPARQTDRFYDYWTLKEAYVKARGVGLSLSLQSFAYHLRPEEAPIAIQFRPSMGDDATAWHFALWSPTPDTRAALAVWRGRGPDATLRFFEALPFGPATEMTPPLRTSARGPNGLRAADGKEKRRAEEQYVPDPTPRMR